MCCNTKEKIALAVKELMRQKSIRKITVQDIMEETGMKRQSFYYHFQDLYAVIEWICCKELMEEVDVDGDITFEEWLRKLMETMEADRAFYKKLANEIEWKQMADRTKAIVAEQVDRFLSASGEMKGIRSEERAFMVDFFSTSIIYYLLDFITSNKNMTTEERSKQIAVAVRTLGKFKFSNGMLGAKRISYKK